MKISRPSPSMVIASIALFVSLGGTSMAAVNYARKAGAVDGKSAVSARSSLSHAAGRLVATKKSGAHKGRLPGKFVSGVPKTKPFSIVTEDLRHTPCWPACRPRGHLDQPSPPAVIGDRRASELFNRPSVRSFVAHRVPDTRHPVDKLEILEKSSGVKPAHDQCSASR